MKKILPVLFALTTIISWAQDAPATIELQDITWDDEHPAFFRELVIDSEGEQLQGFINGANGPGPHPTLILLHGFPGNERNLDLAQLVRSYGWNTIYFNYRGSWGSDGTFTFQNNVEDVVNAVAYLKENASELRVDESRIALFGHSMGGWVCLKALQELPDVKKGFALSTWDIPGTIGLLNERPSKDEFLQAIEQYFGDGYIVLNTSTRDLFIPVYEHPETYDLALDGKKLLGKTLVMLDEHKGNSRIVNALNDAGGSVAYEVWKTDHSFTNKRVSLMKRVLQFLDEE